MKPKSGSLGWDLDLEAEIWATRLGFELPGWDIGLETRIWASRLGLGSRDWDLGLETVIEGGYHGEGGGKNSPYV